MTWARNTRGKKRFAGLLLGFMLWLSNTALHAQTLLPRPDSLIQKRFNWVTAGVAGAGGGSLVGLYSLWYSGYPQSNFHPILDGKEWLGIDKCGHATTGYQIARTVSEAYGWSGVREGKSVLIGSLSAFTYLGVVEVFDGFSAGWGFSWGDMLANTVGTGAFAIQALSPKSPIVKLKFSYQPTDFAALRPDVLGNNFSERLLKDYNGHTYWLTGLPKSKVKSWWIMPAVGYGATGLAGGSNNPPPYDYIKRSQQYYLSFDVNWAQINPRSGALKFLIYVVDIVKIPAPTLEYRINGNWRFHALYF